MGCEHQQVGLPGPPRRLATTIRNEVRTPSISTSHQHYLEVVQGSKKRKRNKKQKDQNEETELWVFTVDATVCTESQLRGIYLPSQPPQPPLGLSLGPCPAVFQKPIPLEQI